MKLLLPITLLLIISMVMAAASFLQLSLALDIDGAFSPDSPPASPPGTCDSKCEGRCAKAGVMKRCLKYCNICCGKCHCVPSGTYGNRSECPCYRDMKDNKGRQKCP
ncbi:unnamed protein product [Linum tenue]|uniref:Uncharacterized protein n=1 Tax=Linum tenue TaxID=586396 RepID=A0AAV0J9U3_9ROSI|nr:unnamed protein product [Linum tenue]